jgi:hypothetical protein
MVTNLAPLSGGQLVVAALRAHGTEMAFGIAGKSYLEVLEVLDALNDAARAPANCFNSTAALRHEARGKATRTGRFFTVRCGISGRSILRFTRSGLGTSLPDGRRGDA